MMEDKCTNFFEEQGIGLLDFFSVQTHIFDKENNLECAPSQTMFVVQIEFVPSLNQYAMKLRELVKDTYYDWIVSESFFKENIHMFTKLQTD